MKPNLSNLTANDRRWIVLMLVGMIMACTFHNETLGMIQFGVCLLSLGMKLVKVF